MIPAHQMEAQVPIFGPGLIRHADTVPNLQWPQGSWNAAPLPQHIVIDNQLYEVLGVVELPHSSSVIRQTPIQRANLASEELPFTSVNQDLNHHTNLAPAGNTVALRQELPDPLKRKFGEIQNLSPSTESLLSESGKNVEPDISMIEAAETLAGMSQDASARRIRLQVKDKLAKSVPEQARPQEEVVSITPVDPGQPAKKQMVVKLGKLPLKYPDWAVTPTQRLLVNRKRAQGVEVSRKEVIDNILKQANEINGALRDKVTAKQPKFTPLPDKID